MVKLLKGMVITVWNIFVLYVALSTIGPLVSLLVHAIPSDVMESLPGAVIGAIELSMNTPLSGSKLVWSWVGITTMYAVHSYWINSDGGVYRHLQWFASYIYTLINWKGILYKYRPGTDQFIRIVSNTSVEFQDALRYAYDELTSRNRFSEARPSLWADYPGVRWRGILRVVPFSNGDMIYEYIYREMLEILVLNRWIRKASYFKGQHLLNYVGLYPTEGSNAMIRQADRSLGLAYPVQTRTQLKYMLIGARPDSGKIDALYSIHLVLRAMSLCDDISVGRVDPDLLAEYEKCIQRLETLNKFHPITLVANKKTVLEMQQHERLRKSEMTMDETIRFCFERVEEVE